MITETLEQKPASELTLAELETLFNAKKEQERNEINQKRADYEALRNETIDKLVTRAVVLSNMLKDFKTGVFDDLSTLYDLLKEYSSRHADGKGNFTIESQDGDYKIEFSRQTLGSFDERADQAAFHIIDFVNSRWSGDVETKELITGILERSKGKFDIKQIQKLYAMEAKFNDPNWLEGIRLFKEAWRPSETKDYTRFWVKYKGEYQAVNLNFSSIKID
jgi:hypothetical protein